VNGLDILSLRRTVQGRLFCTPIRTRLSAIRFRRVYVVGPWTHPSPWSEVRRFHLNTIGLPTSSIGSRRCCSAGYTSGQWTVTTRADSKVTSVNSVSASSPQRSRAIVRLLEWQIDEELERVAGQREPVVSQAARRVSVDCQTARRGPVPLPFAR
jgi:hypothetical protein